MHTTPFVFRFGEAGIHHPRWKFGLDRAKRTVRGVLCVGPPRSSTLLARLGMLLATLVAALSSLGTPSSHSIRVQNEARKAHHAAAAASRELLLDAALHELSLDSTSRGALLPACFHLRELAARIDEQVAAAPVLMGLAALMGSQARTSSSIYRWCVNRAALLNGGDDFVRAIVPIFGLLRLRCVNDIESSGENLTFEVACGAWTFGELRALETLARCYALRLPMGRTAAGRVSEYDQAWQPHRAESLLAALLGNLGAWRVRAAAMAGLV